MAVAKLVYGVRIGVLNRMDWKQILVPTDFSGRAEAALDLALDLAGEIGASVTILHAYHVVIPFSVPPTGAGFRMPGPIVRELAERAEEAVGRLARERAHPGLEIRGRAIEEPPVAAIIGEARRIPADLIVMGSRGSSGWKGAVLGSVAARVIRLAPCPVLTVGARGA